MDRLLIHVDGEAVEARPGDTVAAALLRAGVTTFTRSIKYHRPRGPFCLEGSCGQCLMRVGGLPSVQACRVPVEEGLRCERQNAPLGSVEGDVFRAVDFLFPGGLDHHHIATFSRVAGQVALEVARRLAGLGHLPDKAQPAVPARSREARVVVIGAGPAGLAAARAAAEQGDGVVLLERDWRPGGAALLGVDPLSPTASQIDDLATAAVQAGAQLWQRCEAVGLYADASTGAALLAVRTDEDLCVVRAQRVIVATGGVSQPLAFPGGDRPGVYAARGLVRLAQEHGVLVGPAKVNGRSQTSLAVVGEGRELQLCTARLEQLGYSIAASVEAAQAGRARGKPVRQLQLSSGEKIACDAVAIALPPAPFHELATAAGAGARFDAALGGFAASCDEHGRTAVPWLFAAGRAAGRGGEAALASGRAAGTEAGHG